MIRRSNIPKIFLVLLCGIAGITWYSVFYFERHQELLVSFLDVGQGDAIFIEAPGGAQILIDGGPSDAILEKLGRRMPFWDRSIDLVVATHPHSDHITGLIGVMNRYRVGAVIDSGESYTTPEFLAWSALLEEKHVPVYHAMAGQKISFGKGKKIQFTILYPREGDSRDHKNVHDANVVSLLSYGSTTFLFMGDAERPTERALLENNKDILNADVLKVGHHGSKTSSGEAFLFAVSPRVAVIEVGRKNRYGHPTKEVLNRLEKIGIPVFRTDSDGDVTIRTSGR